MNDVRRRWPEATTEMDASVEARGEYRALRDRVRRTTCRASRTSSSASCNTNTIRELAELQRLAAAAGRARSTTGSTRINEALGAIDYSPGRLHHAGRRAHASTRRSRPSAPTCAPRPTTPSARTTTTTPSSGSSTSQRIIERFRGREGHADADKAWTRRVTDVRNWFTFSASERDRETGEECEHYRDSDGKSGGQKEKLAYTILAASLAYQFGLEWGVERSRDFRFAVIDEAFGRGSDASTRYALELFAKLGLQLLIVTPLQKVHVIEPYVRAIGFVDNPTAAAPGCRP